jgi:hypothetical protein
MFIGISGEFLSESGPKFTGLGAKRLVGDGIKTWNTD